MMISDDLKHTLMPTGVLRASINLGNPILARASDDEWGAAGVSVDLARAFAEQLGAELELVILDSAGKSVDVVTNEEADFGFFAIDPVRGQGIRFTEPYVLITGSYLVPDASLIQTMEQVDQPGIRLVVGKGSAYDLFLTREIQHAEIVRAPTSPTVVDVFVEQGYEVAAGVTQQLQADCLRFSNMRILPGNFMTIRQAMGVPKGRGEAAAALLADFVERMKGNGFVAEALKRHGIEGAQVAPVRL